MVLLVTTYGLWSLLVLTFGLGFSDLTQYWIAAAALLCSILLMARNRLHGLYVLPLVTLIGPIVPIQIANLGTATPTDVYLLLLAMFTFVFTDRRIFKLGPFRREYAAMLLLILLGWALSRYTMKLVIPLLDICELALVYLLTLNIVTKREHGVRLLRSWVIASFVCSLLVLFMYHQNQPLLLDPESGRIALPETLKQSWELFYRATFFYAGFFFIVSMSIIFSLTELLFGDQKRDTGKTLWVLGLIISIITLFLLNNKTAMVMIAAVTLGLLAYWVFRRGRHTSALRLVAYCAVFAVLGIGANAGIRSLVPQSQLQAALERAQNSSSLLERFSIYENVSHFLIQRPSVLVTGLGPEVVTRLPYEPEVEQILKNPVVGRFEGAVDSSYISGLVEYGLFVCLLFWFVTFRTARQLYRTYRARPDMLTMAVAVAISAWMLIGLTQLTGISKPTWLLIQLFAVAHLITSPRFRWERQSGRSPSEAQGVFVRSLSH
jgi:O-Antigen ligase